VVVAAEVFLPRLGYRGIFVMLAISIVRALLLLVRLIKVPTPAPDTPEARGLPSVAASVAR